MNIPPPVNDRFASGSDLGRIPMRHSSGASVCSTESGQSVNFSETQLGQILKREGVLALKDFEVPCKAVTSLDDTKRHLLRRGSCFAATTTFESRYGQ